MSRKKQGTIVTTSLVLAAVLISACQQPYSTPPAITNTPMDPNSLFSTPMGEPDSMQDVENFITQTALAGGPGIAIPTATLAISNATPVGGATSTPTPFIGLNPTITATQAVAVNTSTAAPPSGAKPTVYTLKNGEFPYCIARRFDVNQDQLLSLSGLTNAAANNLSAGTVLTIPQSGGGFVGDRSWHDHPATFTVGASYDTNTVYGAACYYGDIEPSVIAQNNNISVDAVLTAGQVLNIP